MPIFNPPLEIQDHGVDQGPAETINFTGSVSATVANNIATISISGGSFTATVIEVDFGSIPTRSKTFTVTDASISTASHLVINQSGTAATGRSSDENEMDPIIFSGIPASGQFTLIANTLNGPVVGKYRVNYAIG